MSNAFDLTVNALREQGLNSDEILDELSKLFQNLANFTDESKSKKNEEEEIRKLLKKIGMPVHVKGYNYWVEAIRIYKDNKNLSMMRGIYPAVAEIFGINVSKVERGMRFALETTFDRCPEWAVESVFGGIIPAKKGKPTNSEFIAVIAELL